MNVFALRFETDWAFPSASFRAVIAGVNPNIVRLAAASSKSGDWLVNSTPASSSILRRAGLFEARINILDA